MGGLEGLVEGIIIRIVQVEGVPVSIVRVLEGILSKVEAGIAGGGRRGLAPPDEEGYRSASIDLFFY